MITSEDIRKSYVEKKNKVLAVLEKTRGFYTQNGDKTKEEVFEKLKENLENGEFSIVVVGEFSAGKSTLLNALMGQRILPSFTNETTATVNFLRHKDRAINGEVGRVYYRDGEEEELRDLSLATINEYVSTKGDEVANKVEHLDLYLDSQFLEDGVTLVDSPGLNGVADGHREITEQQILKSNASIFLFNSDHPGSKTDFEFLYDLQKKVKTIIFVLNKIDNIKEEEGETVESVIESLKSNYRKQFPDIKTVPEIWPVAAFKALEARTVPEKAGQEEISRLKPFEERLLKFLTCGEKAHQQLISPVDRVISVLNETKSNYEEDLKLLAGKQDTEELESKISEVQEIVGNLSNKIKKSKNNVSNAVSNSSKEIIEELEAQISKLQDRKLEEIDQFEDLDELLEYLDKFEKEFLHKVKSIAMEGEENLKEKIKTVVNMNYVETVDEVNNQLMQSNSSINLDIKNHLNTDVEVYEVGLNEMDEKVQALEEELKQIEENAHLAEEDYIREKELARRKIKLDEEIESLKEAQTIISNRMIPEIQRYTKNVQSREHRGGLLGTVGYVLFGGKLTTHQELKEDSTAHDREEKRKNEELQQNKEEIKKKETKIEEYGEINVELKELHFLREKAKIEQKNEEIAKAKQESINKIDKGYKKQIRKCKRELRRFCDDITDELVPAVRKELKEEQDTYVNIVMNIVEANIRTEMKQKEERLKNLQEQLASSENEKNQQIQDLNEKIVWINTILDESVDIEMELESEEIDTISEEIVAEE